MAMPQPLAELLTQARGYIDTMAYDAVERSTFRAIIDEAQRLHDNSASVEQLQAAGLMVPIRLGCDGEVLDAEGNCYIVVDPNRELGDDKVAVIGKIVVAAVNLCTPTGRGAN